MSQREVYDFLKTQRLSGNEKYFSIREVYNALIDMKRASIPERRGLWRQIKQLNKFGYLEKKGIGGWPSNFRLKDKYARR